MKKIRIELQQTMGGSFHVVSMTNAVKHTSYGVHGRPVTFKIGDYLNEDAAEAVCGDRTVEVRCMAVKD